MQYRHLDCFLGSQNSCAHAVHHRFGFSWFNYRVSNCYQANSAICSNLPQKANCQCSEYLVEIFSDLTFGTTDYLKVHLNRKNCQRTSFHNAALIGCVETSVCQTMASFRWLPFGWATALWIAVLGYFITRLVGKKLCWSCGLFDHWFFVSLLALRMINC